jgi:hypothetical protein
VGNYDVKCINEINSNKLKENIEELDNKLKINEENNVIDEAKDEGYEDFEEIMIKYIDNKIFELNGI